MECEPSNIGKMLLNNFLRLAHKWEKSINRDQIYSQCFSARDHIHPLYPLFNELIKLNSIILLQEGQNLVQEPVCVCNNYSIDVGDQTGEKR